MRKIGFIIGIILVIIAIIWFVTKTLPSYERLKVAEKNLEDAKADEAKTRQELEAAQQRYNEYCASHPEC